MKEKNKINKQMKFYELIEKYPQLIEFLLGKRMHCFGCPAASMETIGQGAIAHGLDPDKLVKELNDKINK